MLAPGLGLTGDRPGMFALFFDWLGWGAGPLGTVLRLLFLAFTLWILLRGKKREPAH